MTDASRPAPELTRTRVPEADGPTMTAIGAFNAPANETPPTPPGYELHSLVGSGGMGAVYRAHDQSLARDVAIKFLHSSYAPDSVTAWRFTEEARITARLQHPGIPPVHHVGKLPDGRPFLAMKLIKGETLDQLLKARQTSADNRGRFVGIFEQVAQAVGFAHSRRIIHRDLKPANVMVGGFGEVQVMDWGLAKELSEGQSAQPGKIDETRSIELRAGREGGETTQAGSLLGTPAFMPPEQAIGAIEQINERSDVFGLGAILCVILTGKPPFVGESAESTRVLAARGKLDDCFTRLDASGAEPELIALAKRCLAPEAGDRPANAGEVASAVAAFRADAERRARQAEMDRATAEVKAAEERKRRRVQRILALTVVGLLAVAGVAAWWIDRERTARRADLIAAEMKSDAERKEREAELKTRQMATERDVAAALNEVQVLREEGWKQADDTHRWGLTLTAARSTLKRAEGLLAAGEPTDALRARVAAAAAELARDDRDRALVADLDRIAEENDGRFMIPIPLSRKPADRYAATFRTHGIDLANAPREQAIEWLKNHRFRKRLTRAIRGWIAALPVDYGMRIGQSVEPPAVLAALGGQMITATPPSLRTQLNAIMDAVTDDPFTRQWWAAVNKHDRDTLKQLLRRPELRQMSSSELSSLADGIINLPYANDSHFNELLRIAYERFPGEYWVNFRLAMHVQLESSKQDIALRRATSLRYLNAAVAARPRSAIARAALAAELWEGDKNDLTAMRIIRGAAEIDPSSPWPHLLLCFMSMETGNWPDFKEAIIQAVRADPDTAFLLASFFFPSIEFMPGLPGAALPDSEAAELIDRLIAIHPNHPGGYQLRSGFRHARNDYRGALADIRAAKTRVKDDDLIKVGIQMQLNSFERLARWEAKLPAVLRGELRPTATEYKELAEYCAGFEQKYALAARFAGDALTADPKLYLSAYSINQFAGWAVQASFGKGTDAANLTAAERAGLRRQALSWLRKWHESIKQDSVAVQAYQIHTNADLAPVRTPKELAKLPPDERIAWENFWKKLPPGFGRARPEVAPAPREVKQ